MSETPPTPSSDLITPSTQAPTESEAGRFADWNALDPNCLKAWRVENWISTVILGAILLAGEFWLRFNWERAWTPGLVSVPLAVVLGLWFQRIAKVRFSVWRFRLEADALVVRQGIWWRSTRLVPRRRIQHVDVNSGPIGRRFGIVQVSVFVAGSLGAVIEMPGLSPEVAEELRHILLKESRASA